MTAEYLTVTEIPGNRASQEQIERLYHRYHFALSFCRDRDVLEVACGAGMGLGYLRKAARTVTGGDIDENILAIAEEHYAGRRDIAVKKLDAQNLPFPQESFDVVLLYEAIYYLSQVEKFIEEAKRVLRPKGMLIVCSVNKDWPDFNPSPFSTKYFSLPELHQLMLPRFQEIKAYGAFPVQADTIRDRFVSFIKRRAVRLHLMPKTMKGKEFYKRVFLGGLISIPSEIEEGTAVYMPPVSIPVSSPNPNYKIFYIVAQA